MADDFFIGGPGPQELARLAARLKAEGNGDLRKELLRGVRESAKKAIPDVQASAREILPKSGGLAERVAEQGWKARSSYSGSGAKVKIVGQGMKELRDIDQGRVRHPVFGNRKKWAAQSLAPGFFTYPMLAQAPGIRKEIQGVMESVARKITGGI